MTSEPLPHHLPRYCMFCGAPLNYTEISAVAGEGSASWNCTGCGKEDTDNWSEFDFTPIDQTDESSTDQELAPSRQITNFHCHRHRHRHRHRRLQD